MKKLVLTLMAGFCFAGAALAQDATKTARKNHGLALASKTPVSAENRDKAKIEKAKAAEAAKSANKAAAKKSLKAETAN